MEEYFFSIEEAKRELKERRSNTDLLNKVMNIFGNNVPNFIDPANPGAYIARTVFTDDEEIKFLLHISSELQLPLRPLEYNSKFVSKNKNMYSLGMVIADPNINVRGRKKKFPIINFNKWEGEMFSEIETLWGEKLYDFHHRMLNEVHPKLSTIDFTEWFNRTRIIDEEYYFYYLLLFVCHGVLLETFMFDDSEEKEFFEKKVIPSMKKIKLLTGFSPIIISVPAYISNVELLDNSTENFTQEAWRLVNSINS